MAPFGKGCAFALLAIVAACRSTGTSVPPQALSLGKWTAPDFTADRLDGGEPVRLSSLRGRVVVLDVWAAWCEGCEKDLPILDEMAARLRACDAAVVAVSIDKDTQRVLPLARLRTWQLMMLHDSRGSVGDLYEPAKMPALYLIDAYGTVQEAWIGFERDHIDAVERAAHALCTQKGSP